MGAQTIISNTRPWVGVFASPVTMETAVVAVPTGGKLFSRLHSVLNPAGGREEGGRDGGTQ